MYKFWMKLFPCYLIKIAEQGSFAVYMFAGR